MNKKWMLLILLCLSGHSYSSESATLEEKLVSKEALGVESCDVYESRLKENVKDGFFLRNKVWTKIPHFIAWFKHDGYLLQLPMQMVNVNQDSKYGLLYLYDVAFPDHRNTKLYFVKYLPDSVVLSLADGPRSPLYQPFMESLSENFSWDRTGDIVSGAKRINLPVYFDNQINEGERLRSTLIEFDRNVFLFVEELLSKKSWLIKFKNAETLEESAICSFDNLLK